MIKLLEMMPGQLPRTNRRARAAATLCMWGGLAFLFLNDQITDISRKLRVSRRHMKEARENFRRDLSMVKPYTKEDVLKTQEIFASGCANLLMIFNSESGSFHTYDDARLLNNRRPDQADFIMANALYSFFPDRFKPGSPPMQILFSTDDYPTIDLRNIDLTQEKVAGDENKTFAPVLQFGSVPRDENMLNPVPIIEMPFAKIMPCFGRRVFHKYGLGRCLFDEGTLPSLIKGTNINIPSWDELRPQIVWRGADYQFLERFNLGMDFGNRLVSEFDDATTLQFIVKSLFDQWDNLFPRWKAVTLSLEASLDAAQNQDMSGEESMPWIDVKFFEKAYNTRHDEFLSAGAMISTNEFMTYDEQMMYKYHIDFGGGGGTTWTGTLSKLAMPGVLFHHETVMRDFYFDHVKPWVHYIPVKEDLSDLRGKFDWAEANPDKAKAISEAATEFIQTMDSSQWFNEMYKHYFREQLGNVVNAYVPSDDESLQSIVRDYRKRGIQLRHFSRCDKNTCFKPAEGYGFDFRLVDGFFEAPLQEEE